MGADFENIERMNSDFLRPDLTLVLKVDPEICISRVEDRGEDGHVFENLSFQDKVSKRYLGLNEELEENIIYVDGTSSINEVFENLRKRAESIL